MAAPTSATMVHGVTTAMTLTLADTWYEALFPASSDMYSLSCSAAFRLGEGITDNAATGGHIIPADVVILQQWVPSSGKLYMRSPTAGAICQITGSDRRRP